MSRRSSNLIRYSHLAITAHVYEDRTILNFNCPATKHETVEEFLKRGGEIKKYAYKRPPPWGYTFNGRKPLKRRGSSD